LAGLVTASQMASASAASFFCRLMSTKTPEQQSCLMLHRTRHLFIRQQTSVINAIRAHLAEFGIIAPVGLPPS
jgi:transposase